MGSDNNLCEWHLPRLDQPKVAEKHHKKRNSQKAMEPQKQSRSYSFQHFPDPAMYIDDYRKKHTLAHAASDWKPSEHHFPKKHHNGAESLKYHVQAQAQYIDIRMPERKICLTGLPQLQLPHNAPRRVVPRDVDDARPFMSDVPHLPRLKLNGISKTIKERNRNHEHEKERHKKTKIKKGRLPFLKPDIDFSNNEERERQLHYNFPVP